MSDGRRRVALLCLDLWRDAHGGDHRPFNYAVRRIQAAIVGHPELDKSVEVRLIEATSFDMNDFLTRIEEFDPDVIGVSAYVWSFPLLLEVCRRAKRARTDRSIVFGGPSARPEMFELPQHRDGADVVDAICIGEGEECIQEILLAPDQTRATLMKIRGLAVFKDGHWQHTGERKLAPPDSYPSPYELGLMPPDRTCIMESFRGCPLSCTFCEWGDTGVTARAFGYEHLVRELERVRKGRAHSTWLVDPGLNLHAKAFKALARAEAETGALAQIGMFRCEIYPSHMTDEHLRFLQQVRARYAGIGLQSLNLDVLQNVERPFSEDRFNKVVAEVASIVPDTVVELILGLPGDSPEGFRRTVEKVLKLPVSIRVFHCLVLPSALMTRAPANFQLEFDPYTLQVMSCRGWSRDDLEKTRDWLDTIAYNEENHIKHGGTWKFYRKDRPETRPPDLDTKVGSLARIEQSIRDMPDWLAARMQGEQRIPEIIAPSAPELVAAAGPSDEDTPRVVPPAPVPDAIFFMLQRHVRDSGPWVLNRATQLDDNLHNGLIAYVGRSDGEPGSFRLSVAREGQIAQHYRVVNGIAYAYESDESGAAPNIELKALHRLIAQIHPIMRVVLFGMKLGGNRAALPVV